MDIKKINQIIQQGESNTIEFKTSMTQLSAAFKTICAFLNGEGGIVLIGVGNRGKLIGQNITDNTRREIAREKKKIEPTAQIDVHYINREESKTIIAIQVDAGEHSPYIYDGRPYQRDESETNRMSQHHYEQLLVKRGQLNHAWEEAFAPEYTLSDLDQEEIYRTVMDGIAKKRIPPSIAKEEPEKILRQLDLMTDKKLKRAAIVLFAKEIKSSYLQCWLKMARFRGISKSNEFIDNQQMHCNVFRMLEEVDHFLNRHLPIASYFKSDQWQRIDKPVLPVLAVREALVNAACHRNYADRSGYVSIAIFDDCLEIWNSGTLPEKLKIADLKRKHDSILRNKLIANVFYLRGYIETWGTGTITMSDLCKENGIPVPKFTERTGGFVVAFKFAEPIGATSRKTNTNKTLLSVRQEEILQILQNQKSLRANEIFDKLKEPPSLRTVKADLLVLKKKELIEQQGKGPNTVWKLKA